MAKKYTVVVNCSEWDLNIHFTIREGKGDLILEAQRAIAKKAKFKSWKEFESKTMDASFMIFEGEPFYQETI